MTRPLPSIWRPTSCSPAKSCKFYDKTNPGRCLTALPGFAIMSIERALRQAVGPSSRFTVFENRHRAGWRFLLFHANGECQSKQVECQSNWHILTPSGSESQTACRCFAVLCPPHDTADIFKITYFLTKSNPHPVCHRVRASLFCRIISVFYGPALRAFPPALRPGRDPARPGPTPGSGRPVPVRWRHR